MRWGCATFNVECSTLNTQHSMFNIHESMFNDIYGLESGSITPPFRVGWKQQRNWALALAPRKDLISL